MTKFNRSNESIVEEKEEIRNAEDNRANIKEITQIDETHRIVSCQNENMTAIAKVFDYWGGKAWENPCIDFTEESHHNQMEKETEAEKKEKDLAWNFGFNIADANQIAEQQYNTAKKLGDVNRMQEIENRNQKDISISFGVHKKF